MIAVADIAPDVRAAENHPVKAEQGDAGGVFGEVVLLATHGIDDGVKPDPMSDVGGEDAEYFHLVPTPAVNDDHQRDSEDSFGRQADDARMGNRDRQEPKSEGQAGDALRAVIKAVENHSARNRE